MDAIGIHFNKLLCRGSCRGSHSCSRSYSYRTSRCGTTRRTHASLQLLPAIRRALIILFAEVNPLRNIVTGLSTLRNKEQLGAIRAPGCAAIVAGMLCHITRLGSRFGLYDHHLAVVFLILMGVRKPAAVRRPADIADFMPNHNGFGVCAIGIRDHKRLPPTDVSELFAIR